MTEAMLYFVVSAVCGYIIFRFLLFYVPRRMLDGEKQRYREIVDESLKEADSIKKANLIRTEQELSSLEAEQEESLAGKREDLNLIDSDLDTQEEHLRQEEDSLKYLQRKIQSKADKRNNMSAKLQTAQKKLTDNYQAMHVELAQHCGENYTDLRDQKITQMIDTKNIEYQRDAKALVSNLNAGAKQIAQRFLSRTHARYRPEFIWPRLLNSVEVKDGKMYQSFHNDERVIQDLIDLADGVQIKCHEDQQKVTLNGGLGVAREALRLTIQSMLAKKSKWDKMAQTYANYRNRLEREASRLGSEACDQLQLQNIAPEIQKLVGYLNWRTSYKQNQWYHSIEVATLAGLLGHELGVDPQSAQRCGLLHDIGKAIDYRIEGSHAVISGDYADRYGESRIICDAVMSHHNDLILETPLAYVLKAADTLSGARPGARVNLEDDYQSRLNAIEDVIMTFDGITKVEPMHGAKEVRVEVDQRRIKESDLEALAKDIAQKLSEEVAFPGQIKVMVTRRFEATQVA